MSEKLLSIKDAAPLLGLTEWTLRELCRLKLIKHMKLGPRRGKYKFTEEWLEDYKRECTVETASSKKKQPSKRPVSESPRRNSSPRLTNQQTCREAAKALREKMKQKQR